MRQRLAAQAERDERHEHRIDAPPDKQRQAHLDEQLPKAPLLNEYDHAVKRQRQAERLQDVLFENRIGVVEDVQPGEGEQGGGERDPPAARDSRDGEIGEQRRAAYDEHRESARRRQLGGEVVPERHDRQFHESVAADRKTAVKRVSEAAAVVVYPHAARQAEVVFGRQILGNPQRLGGEERVDADVVERSFSVKIPPVPAQREQRGEGGEQNPRRRPTAPIGEARALEREREHGGAIVVVVGG